MNKDKEWLKAQFKDEECELKSVYDNYVPYEKVLIADDVNDLIDQLDEPELPVIPQFVADHIEHCKTRYKRLNVALSESHETMMMEHMDISIVVANEVFARAWLDGYTIEKQPKKLYIVKFPFTGTGETTLIQSVLTGTTWNEDIGCDDYEFATENYKHLFTEQEIKSIDSRYWAFAEEVPNE